jgi:DNA-directed RNA polymerase specialized sigma subunit
MPGPYNLPGIPKPTQATGGPRPPSAPKPVAGTALEPEFSETYNHWSRDPNPETNDMMLKALHPIIDNAVKTYAGSADNSVIRSKAKKIVIDTLPNYDPNNTKLKTYVFNQLQGLKRFSLQQNQIINIPEQVQLDYVNLKKTENSLKEELGRDPSDTELADATSMSLKRLNYVRKLQMPSSEGTVLQPMMHSDSSDFNDPSVASRVNKDDMNAWHSFVYDSLGDIDKIIMEHSFGLNGKSILSNQEIAKKLRISPAAISLRKNKIQQELDKRESLRVI